MPILFVFLHAIFFAYYRLLDWMAIASSFSKQLLSVSAYEV